MTISQSHAGAAVPRSGSVFGQDGHSWDNKWIVNRHGQDSSMRTFPQLSHLIRHDEWLAVFSRNQSVRFFARWADEFLFIGVHNQHRTQAEQFLMDAKSIGEEMVD